MSNTLTIDFTIKNNIVSNYIPGTPVTRENFVSFLILSFALSRGKPELQRMFFHWTDLRVSFPHAQVMEDFVTNGGFESLSTEEQKLFYDAFLNVKKHSGEFDPSEFIDEIKDEIEALHERPFKHGSLERTLLFFDFATIESIPDFCVSANRYIEWLKEQNN